MPHTPNPAALTVLVVDDDDINLDVAQELLEQLGVGQIHVALSGTQGLKKIKSLPHVDYVIVDIYMPDMDGIEFVAELAKLKFTGAAIMVSGVNLETLALAKQLASANGITVAAAMEKPLRKEYLALAIGVDCV